MNVSVVRQAPIVPPVRSVVVVLTKEEAVELQRTITSCHLNPVKDRLYDALRQTFIAEGLGGYTYCTKGEVEGA